MLIGGLAVMFYLYAFLLYPRCLYKSAELLNHVGIHIVCGIETG